MCKVSLKKQKGTHGITDKESLTVQATDKSIQQPIRREVQLCFTMVTVTIVTVQIFYEQNSYLQTKLEPMFQFKTIQT